MSEFDFYGDNSGGKSRSKRTSLRGEWFFPLTILGLCLVGGLSILMCFLTRGVKDRPLWLMGLIFMVPAGAMFFSAMLLEFKTGAMTPSTSRKPQVIVAVVATLLTFMVGCVCDAIYLYGCIRNAGVNFVLAVDRGDTITWSAYDTEGSPARGEELNACAQRLVEKMPKYTDVGVITFEWDILSAHPVQKATKKFKDALPGMLQEGGYSGVSYYTALDAAVALAESTKNKLPTRIVLLTGGDEAVYLIDDNGDVFDTIANQADYNVKTVAQEQGQQQIIERLRTANCSLYVISPKGEIDEGLANVVTQTGGLSVSIAEAETVPQFVSLVTVDGDMLRATTTPAKVLTGVMLVLEGLVTGICMSIMLSVARQKRVQMIISPVMAILSFVMVKLLGTPADNPVGLWWLWEGLSFLPLGVIFMTSNGNTTAAPVNASAGGWGDSGANMDLFGGNSDPNAGLGEWGEGTADPWGSSDNKSSSNIDW